MRTRSQSLASKRKIEDAVSGLDQVDEESTLTNQRTAIVSKRRKTTKTLLTEDHVESVTVEKRLRCYLPKPTPAIRTRIQRALNQRLYLLAISSAPDEPIRREYRVFGQTGNVYTVTITHLASCTCPDHANGYLCKHIIFVLHRVLKVDRHSPLLHQKALLTIELNEIFAKADAQRSGNFSDSDVLAEREVREAYRVTTGDPDAILETSVDATATVLTTATTVQQKPITADDDCPICCESMEDETNDANNILFCSTSCGNSMHVTCFNKWRRAKTLTNDSVTCPFCRIEWKTATIDNPEPIDAVYTTTGYLNLAAHSTTLTNNDRAFYDSYPRYNFNYKRRSRRRY